jgi:uncharacterized protein (TIGR03067 family)
LLLLLAVSAVPAAESNDPAALRRQLIGTWTGAVVSGDSARPGSPRNSLREVVITADTISAHDSDGRYLGTGTYTVARGADGRLTIDATGTDGPARGQMMPGIWKLEGGVLHWCSANAGKPRPAEFKTQSSGPYLMVLRRKQD